MFTDEKKDHILVISKGRYYTFPVLDSNGNILPPEEIHACVDYIVNKRCDDAQHSLGVLTSLDRNKWAELREKLESLNNKENLRQIDSALFCISLDDLDTNDVDKLATSFLHGDAKNRSDIHF